MKIYINKLALLFLILAGTPVIVYSQQIDSLSFRLVPRQSFYSFEDKGEFLLHIPISLSKNHLSIVLKTGDQIVASWNGIPGNNIIRLPFALSFKPSVYK